MVCGAPVLSSSIELLLSFDWLFICLCVCVCVCVCVCFGGFESIFYPMSYFSCSIAHLGAYLHFLMDFAHTQPEDEYTLVTYEVG